MRNRYACLFEGFPVVFGRNGTKYSITSCDIITDVITLMTSPRPKSI